MSIESLANQLMTRTDELSTYSEMDGGITRRYGTPPLEAVFSIVEGWMRDAGLRTGRDPFRNLIGTWEAAPGSTETRPFVIGGHLDSVRDAGRYDGILGVLSGIAVIERLNEEGRRLPFPVQLVAFADEEGLRYSTLLASRVWTGLPLDDRLAQKDADGIALADAIRTFGGDPDALANRETPEILGFLETHIEQGPVLEGEGLPVGVVSSIVGSERATITVTGMAGHAGTVPMALRRDALSAASEIVLAAEGVGRETAGLVATVGELTVKPGASNVIPGEVRLTCEVRHASIETCVVALAKIRARAEAIGSERGIELQWEDARGYVPTRMDESLAEHLEAAIRDEGIRPMRLVSGAGHDAINIAQIAPVSMLFVRCKDGISHNPAESITEDDAAVAISVMVRFLNRLAEVARR
jgi:allantoate deiminase